MGKACLITLALSSQLIAALVTLETVRNLTVVTDECRERIVGRIGAGDGHGIAGMREQFVFASRGEDEDDGGEVEDVSTSLYIPGLRFRLPI